MRPPARPPSFSSRARSPFTPRPRLLPRSEEFKKHKKADAKFLGPFFREWTSYVEQLEKQSVAAGPIGSSLDSALASSLSEEQQAQLSKLREEAEKASWH